jgi:hypothetical protein
MSESHHNAYNITHGIAAKKAALPTDIESLQAMLVADRTLEARPLRSLLRTA